MCKKLIKWLFYPKNTLTKQNSFKLTKIKIKAKVQLAMKFDFKMRSSFLGCICKYRYIFWCPIYLFIWSNAIGNKRCEVWVRGWIKNFDCNWSKPYPLIHIQIHTTHRKSSPSYTSLLSFLLFLTDLSQHSNSQTFCCTYPWPWQPKPPSSPHPSPLSNPPTVSPCHGSNPPPSPSPLRSPSSCRRQSELQRAMKPPQRP